MQHKDAHDRYDAVDFSFCKNAGSQGSFSPNVSSALLSPRIVVPHSSLFLQLSRENTDFRCFDLIVLYADMPEQHQLAIHIQLNRFTGANNKAYSLRSNHIKHKQQYMAACCNSDLVDMQYCAVRILTASVAVITIFVVQSKSPDAPATAAQA